MQGGHLHKKIYTTSEFSNKVSLEDRLDGTFKRFTIFHDLLFTACEHLNLLLAMNSASPRREYIPLYLKKIKSNMSSKQYIPDQLVNLTAKILESASAEEKIRFIDDYINIFKTQHDMALVNYKTLLSMGNEQVPIQGAVLFKQGVIGLVKTILSKFEALKTEVLKKEQEDTSVKHSCSIL